MALETVEADAGEDEGEGRDVTARGFEKPTPGSVLPIDEVMEYLASAPGEYSIPAADEYIRREWGVFIPAAYMHPVDGGAKTFLYEGEDAVFAFGSIEFGHPEVLRERVLDYIVLVDLEPVPFGMLLGEYDSEGGSYFPTEEELRAETDRVDAVRLTRTPFVPVAGLLQVDSDHFEAGRIHDIRLLALEAVPDGPFSYSESYGSLVHYQGYDAPTSQDFRAFSGAKRDVPPFLPGLILSGSSVVLDVEVEGEWLLGKREEADVLDELESAEDHQTVFTLAGLAPTASEFPGWVRAWMVRGSQGSGRFLLLYFPDEGRLEPLGLVEDVPYRPIPLPDPLEAIYVDFEVGSDVRQVAMVALWGHFDQDFADDISGLGWLVKSNWLSVGGD